MTLCLIFDFFHKMDTTMAFAQYDCRVAKMQKAPVKELLHVFLQ